MFEMGAKFDEGWKSDNKKEKKLAAQTPGKTLPPECHRLRFCREKRRGKVVTVCKPFALEKGEIKKLLTALKKELGTGGTVRGDTLEFQGDCADSLRRALSRRGFGFR